MLNIDYQHRNLNINNKDDFVGFEKLTSQHLFVRLVLWLALIVQVSQVVGSWLKLFFFKTKDHQLSEFLKTNKKYHLLSTRKWVWLKGSCQYWAGATRSCSRLWKLFVHFFCEKVLMSPGKSFWIANLDPRFVRPKRYQLTRQLTQKCISHLVF